MNPLISKRGAEQAEFEFVVNRARRLNDQKNLREAHNVGEPPFQTSRDALAFENLVQRYGGIYHKEPHRVWAMIRATLTGLLTPREIWRIIHANKVSLDAMNDEPLRLDLRSSITTLDVPVALFLGRYDRHLDAMISASYFANLRAPSKRHVWFEHSAHNVPFEDPARFNVAVVSEIPTIKAAAHLRCP